MDIRHIKKAVDAQNAERQTLLPCVRGEPEIMNMLKLTSVRGINVLEKKFWTTTGVLAFAVVR